MIARSRIHRWLRVASSIGLALAGTFAFLVFHPVALDLNRFRPDIERELTSLLGHPVSVSGDVKLVIGRTISGRAEQIRVGNPDGWPGQSTSLATLERFETSIGLVEALRREIALDDLAVAGLTISLEETSNGARNWEPSGPGRKPASGAAGDPSAGVDLILTELKRLAVTGLELTRQEGGQAPERVVHLESLLGAVRLGEPIMLSVAGEVLDLPFSGVLHGGTLAELRDQRTVWPLELEGRLGSATLHLDGHMSADDFRIPGELHFELEIPEIGDLIPSIGHLPGIAPIRLSGDSRRESPDQFQLANVQGTLGGAPLKAGLRLDLSGELPRIEGGIEVASVDLRSGPGRAADVGAKAGTEVTAKTGPDAGVLLPFVGDLTLKVGSITGPLGELVTQNLSVGFAVEPHQASAQVSLTHAEALLTGTAEVQLREGKDFELRTTLQGTNADLSALLKSHVGDDRYRGRLQRIDLALHGTGPDLTTAWEHRETTANLEDASLLVRLGKADVSFAVRQGELHRKFGEPGRFHFVGAIGEAPCDIQMEFRQEVRGDQPKAAYGSVSGTVGDMKFLVDAQAADKAIAEDAKFTFSLNGKRLNTLNSVWGLNLPALGPYSAKGILSPSTAKFTLQEMDLSIGTSKLTGSAVVETAGARPVVTLDLAAPTLQLDDFRGPTRSVPGQADGSGAAPTTARRDPPLSHAVLSRFDGTAKVKVGEVRSGKDRWGGGSATATLNGARLSLSRMRLAIPGGDLSGDVVYHPKAGGTLDWSLKINAKHFDYGLLARRAAPGTTFSGLIDATVDAAAKGVPFGPIELSQASGRVDFDACPENLNAGTLDRWSTNLLLAVLRGLDHQRESKLNCVVGRLRLENGVLLPDSLGLDTTRVRVAAEGKIDLAKETVDLKLQPFPKQPQLFSLEVPVGVQGNLRAPTIKMGNLAMVRAGASMARNTVLFPLRTVTSERLPANGSDLCSCARGSQP